jgi:hypothetical protein
MEAISAMEMLTRLKKKTTMMYIYIRPAVPPLPRPKTMVLKRPQSIDLQQAHIGTLQTYPSIACHVCIRIIANPKMDKNPKFRYGAVVSLPSLTKVDGTLIYPK